MNFTLSTVEEDNKQRIQQYWHNQARQLYQQKAKQNSISKLVQHRPSEVDWSEQTSKKHINATYSNEGSDLMYSANSELPARHNPNNKQTLNSLVNSLQISQIHSPDLKYLCSIEASLDKSHQLPGQPVSVTGWDERKSNQQWSQNHKQPRIIYADSFSDRAVSEQFHLSLNSHEFASFGSTLMEAENKSVDITKDMNASQRAITIPDKYIQINEFHTASSNEQQPQIAKQLHTRKEIRNSFSEHFNPVTTKLHSNHYSSHPLSSQLPTDNTKLLNKSKQQYTLPLHSLAQHPQNYALGSTDKIIGICKLLGMSKTSRKRKAELKIPFIRYNSGPKTTQQQESRKKSNAIRGQKTNSKVKIKVVSVENSKEKVESRFNRLTDTYDQQLFSNKYQTATKNMQKKQPVPIESGDEAKVCCAYPFDIDKQCVDTGRKCSGKKERDNIRMTLISRQFRQPASFSKPETMPMNSSRYINRFQSMEL